jgi:hypothetical protein
MSFGQTLEQRSSVQRSPVKERRLSHTAERARAKAQKILNAKFGAILIGYKTKRIYTRNAKI